MNVVWIVAAAILLLAGVVTLVRLFFGPGTLDRLVSLDTMVALAMCGLALWAISSGDTTVVPSIVALSLLSFLGSTAVARFRVRDDER